MGEETVLPSCPAASVIVLMDSGTCRRYRN